MLNHMNWLCSIDKKSLLFITNCQNPNLPDFLSMILDNSFDSSRNIYFNHDYQGADKEDAEYLKLVGDLLISL